MQFGCFADKWCIRSHDIKTIQNGDWEALALKVQLGNSRLSNAFSSLKPEEIAINLLMTNVPII